MNINNKNTEEVRNRLRMIRKNLQLSQIEIADKIGITQASYSNIETGDTKTISKRTLKSLEKELDVNISWLLDGKGSMFETYKNIGANTDKPIELYNVKVPIDEAPIQIKYSEWAKMIEIIRSQQETINNLTRKNGTAASV